MPRTLLRVDLGLAPHRQDPPPHNRWHPEIPPVVSVEQGSTVRVECLDGTGGQVANDDTADDVARLDLTQVHYVSGPIEVKGAEPGDLLAVDVLDLGPLPGAEWGYTCILGAGSAGGLLADLFPEPRKAVWDLDGVYASSRHVRGVRLVGMVHPGVAGCAPSPEVLDRWNEREAHAAPSAHRWDWPLEAARPEPVGALLGRLAGGGNRSVAACAARTWAAREHGGNMDVKDLTRGARAYFPVYVPGARFSVGDLQFSQGDGKVAGFGGIKMAGWIDLCFGVIRNGMERFGIEGPVFRSSPVRPRSGQSWNFGGVSVTDEGEQRPLDVFTAYRQACLAAIRHLTRFGYAEEQVLMILCAAPVEGRLSCLLQHPNVQVTLSLPEGIFDFDVGPEAGPRITRERGTLARPS